MVVGGCILPPPTPPLPKNRRGVETEIEARLSRSDRRHNDSYLHTFRLCKHLHIQKKKKKNYSAIPPCLLSVSCVCMCTRALARLRACGGNVSEGVGWVGGGGDNSSFVCRACQYVCVTCVTHCCLRSETGIGRPMWPCVTT